MIRLVYQIKSINRLLCNGLHHNLLEIGSSIPSIQILKRKYSDTKVLPYVCESCGSKFMKWQGQCPSCREWNTVVENKINSVDNKTRTQAHLQKTSSIDSTINVVSIQSLNNSDHLRYTLSSHEINRVFGGGIVKDSVTLIGGEPGIGKSTFILQLCNDLCNISKTNILYISGEENMSQIYLRANRLHKLPKQLYLSHETNLDSIMSFLLKHKSEYPIVVIDSIQTIYTAAGMSSPGSPSQIRECSILLQSFAKENNITLFIVGHVTKSGDIAGPKVLEHIVDTVLYLEGDTNTNYRFLRGIKNRYGNIDEIGMFEMKESGLTEIHNDYSFLSHKPGVISNEIPSGSSVGIAFNGSRAVPIEIQSLIIPSYNPPPKHRIIGLSYERLQLLLAVLNKREHIYAGNHDIFVNLLGGLEINDIGVDLSLALSLVSSIKDKSIQPNICFIGEIGLTGELRNVKHIDQRIRIASQLGFKYCYTPHLQIPPIYDNMQIIQKNTLKDVLKDLI